MQLEIEPHLHSLVLVFYPEVIFTSAGKQLITPGTIGFSPDEQTTYYLKVVNDGSTGSVNLDFTYVPLEELDRWKKKYM